MRRLVPILVCMLAVPSCKKREPPSPSPLPKTSVAVVPAPLAPAHPQPAPGEAIPTVVERDDPATAPIMRCPSGASIGGALPPEGTEAWCQLEGGKRHGPIVAFFPMGGKRMQGEYRDGLEHGVWQEYFDGGRLRSEKLYERGRKAGVWTTYHHDGMLATELVHTSDTEQHVTEYRPDGMRARAGAMRGGERHGKWTEWTVDGHAREVEYSDGSGTKVVGAGMIGIAECDEYIDKYRKCIEDKAPRAARVAMNDAMDAVLESWRKAAKGPGAEALGPACKAALDAAKTATASMGCQW